VKFDDELLVVQDADGLWVICVKDRYYAWLRDGKLEAQWATKLRSAGFVVSEERRPPGIPGSRLNRPMSMKDAVSIMHYIDTDASLRAMVMARALKGEPIDVDKPLAGQ
jgi:hypothetical protein